MHLARSDLTGPARDGAAIRQRLAFVCREVAPSESHGPVRAQARDQGLLASGVNGGICPGGAEVLAREAALGKQAPASGASHPAPGHRHQAYFAVNAVQTGGGTNFDTSPPSRAISFTSFEAIA